MGQVLRFQSAPAGSPVPLRINGLPWRLSLRRLDAELQRAFVVIKTECQAEEGWQWIKACLV